jgi:hypothetical protein
MRILLTGGAGYIGSHIALALLEDNHNVYILDNHSNSNPRSVDAIKKVSGFEVPVFVGDVSNKELLKSIFNSYNIEAVLHLAGYNEEAMKKDNKKRTDLSIEVKKDNFVDKANGVKTVKVDKLTEDELKVLIGRILNESLEEASTSVSINDLTYEKATEIAGSSKFYIERNSGIENTNFINNDSLFKTWKEKLPAGDKLKTLTYKVYSDRGIFEFNDPDMEKHNAGNNTSSDTGRNAVSDFNSTLGKYKGD